MTQSSRQLHPDEAFIRSSRRFRSRPACALRAFSLLLCAASRQPFAFRPPENDQISHVTASGCKSEKATDCDSLHVELTQLRHVLDDNLLVARVGSDRVSVERDLAQARRIAQALHVLPPTIDVRKTSKSTSEELKAHLSMLLKLRKSRCRELRASTSLTFLILFLLRFNSARVIIPDKLLTC